MSNQPDREEALKMARECEIAKLDYDWDEVFANAILEARALEAERNLVDHDLFNKPCKCHECEIIRSRARDLREQKNEGR